MFDWLRISNHWVPGKPWGSPGFPEQTAGALEGDPHQQQQETSPTTRTFQRHLVISNQGRIESDRSHVHLGYHGFFHSYDLVDIHLNHFNLEPKKAMDNLNPRISSPTRNSDGLSLSLNGG